MNKGTSDTPMARDFSSSAQSQSDPASLDRLQDTWTSRFCPVHVLVFYCCCNKLPQDNYHHGLKSRLSDLCSSLQALRENHISLPFPASRGCLHSLACTSCPTFMLQNIVTSRMWSSSCSSQYSPSKLKFSIIIITIIITIIMKT